MWKANCVSVPCSTEARGSCSAVGEAGQHNWPCRL